MVLLKLPEEVYTTVPLYEFAAKQPKKEHKLGVKNFL